MKKPGEAEKQFLQKVSGAARNLQRVQRGVEIGEMISLVRRQLMMSQRSLAKRANIPQSTISKIESGSLQPNVSTLQRILDALECDLLIIPLPRKPLGEVREQQALEKAKKHVEYLQGTMSLEKQMPGQDFLGELVKKEVEKLLRSPGRGLWEEES